MKLFLCVWAAVVGSIVALFLATIGACWVMNALMRITPSPIREWLPVGAIFLVVTGLVAAAITMDLSDPYKGVRG